jgi:hypothetical protein
MGATASNSWTIVSTPIARPALEAFSHACAEIAGERSAPSADNRAGSKARRHRRAVPERRRRHQKTRCLGWSSIGGTYAAQSDEAVGDTALVASPTKCA